MKSAVCVYVRNEETNILEWILYNTVIGFDTVIVMDNLSEDRTRAIALSCQVQFDVRVEEWPDISADAQKNCYNHVLATYGSEFEWIAFIDSDEFIVPVVHGSVPAFLESIGDHAAVAVNWAVFGANGHEAMPDGLVIENFNRRAEAAFPPNRHTKSIVRPALTYGCAHPHLFHVRGETWDADGRYSSDYVDPAGLAVVWGDPGLTRDAPDLAICRVHHYFTRSRGHWDKKMLRKWRDTERHYSAFDYHNRNEIEDDCARVFTAETRRRMGLISG